MAKYAKEIASVAIGVLLMVLIFSMSHVAQEEATQAKEVRVKEVKALLDVKRKVPAKSVTSKIQKEEIEQSVNDEGRKEEVSKLNDAMIEIEDLEVQNQNLQEEKRRLKEDLNNVRIEVKKLTESILKAKQEIIEESLSDRVVEEEKEVNTKPIPHSFSSYIVSVKIDLKESTDAQKAIFDVKKACSIIGTAPLVQNTEIVGVKGRICEGDKEDLFDIEMETE